MVERLLKYGVNLPWKKVPDLLEEGEVDLAVTSTNNRVIVEFRSDIENEIKEVLERIDGSARVVSGQNPSTIMIYAKEGVSADSILQKIKEKSKTKLEEV